MKVYLSSTYTDLQRHRAIVAKWLRKAQHEVVMMEEYVAREQRVEFACCGDVSHCDIYVGIFAWRYGHIPKRDNPRRLSVTEMEYAAAGATPITRLTFLLDDKARWPEARRDAKPARIRELRARLKELCSGRFVTAEGLALEVLAALRVHDNTRSPQQPKAIDIMLKAQELGPSYMLNIQENLRVLGEMPLIELQTGPTPWWNTRLHLVAALAQEFDQNPGFVFVDAQHRFVTMASASEIRRRLALRWPALDKAYADFRRLAPTHEAMQRELWRYPNFVSEAFEADERVVKHVLSPRDLDYELGIATLAEIVEVSGKDQRFLQLEIIGRQTPFVALVRGKRLEGLVDRQKLAQRVAEALLAHLA